MVSYHGSSRKKRGRGFLQRETFFGVVTRYPLLFWGGLFMWKNVLLFFAISLVFLFLVSCYPVTYGSIEGYARIQAEGIADVMLLVTSLGIPEQKLQVQSDANGFFQVTGLRSGNWSVQASYTSPGNLLFTANATISVAAEGPFFLELELHPQPFSDTTWALAILSQDDLSALEGWASIFAPYPTFPVTVMRKTAEEGVEGYYWNEGQWKQMCVLQQGDWEERTAKFLALSREVFPSDRHALLLQERGFGWRSAYPESVFYEKTTSALEYDRIFEGLQFDVLYALGSYSTLLETLYQWKDHFTTVVGFQSEAIDLHTTFAEGLAPLTSQSPLAASSVANHFFQASLPVLQARQGQLEQEQKGLGMSVVQMASLQSLADAFLLMVGDLEFLLSEADVSRFLRMDLGYTFEWQTLQYDFSDYKDMGAWAHVLEELLDGKLVRNGFCVYSNDEGFSYDSANPNIQQALQHASQFGDALEQTVINHFQVGFSADIQKTEGKWGFRNYANATGIGFWYPVGVRGGLWNVFGKENYDRLAFSAFSGWPVFLNRLLSVQDLPSEVRVRIGSQGQLVSQAAFDPTQPLEGSGAAFFAGFIDRQAIDRIWMKLGESYFSEMTLAEEGGAYFEDESSIRMFLPVSANDFGKAVGGRVLLVGKEEPVEFTTGMVLPPARGHLLMILDEEHNGLLDVQPGHSCSVSLEHLLEFEARMQEGADPLLLDVQAVVYDQTGCPILHVPLAFQQVFQGQQIWKSTSLSARDVAASGVFRTELWVSQKGTQSESWNQATAQNWVIEIIP